MSTEDKIWYAMHGVATLSFTLVSAAAGEVIYTALFSALFAVIVAMYVHDVRPTR